MGMIEEIKKYYAIVSDNRAEDLHDGYYFDSAEKAEDDWYRQNIRDRENYTNPRIVKCTDMINENGDVDWCCEDLIKYLYLSHAEERLVNQLRKVIDEVEHYGYSDIFFETPEAIRDVIKYSEEYTISDDLCDNGHTIIWFKDILFDGWDVEKKKPDVAYDCIEDRFLTEEEMHEWLGVITENEAQKAIDILMHAVNHSESFIYALILLNDLGEVYAEEIETILNYCNGNTRAADRMIQCELAKYYK